MRHPRRSLFTLTACLVLLQAADFCLTWVLLASGLRSDVYEANPLAQTILSRTGWVGLAGFKAACSLIALTAILAVSRCRVVAATRLLVGLCLVMAGVVGYSGVLLASPPPAGENLAHLARKSEEITESIKALGLLDAERSAICLRLLEGRIDLPTAVEEMRVCVSRYGPDLIRNYRDDFPDPAQTPQVAGYLYYHATRLHRLPPELTRRLEDLANETTRLYPTVCLIDSRTPSYRPRMWRAYSSDASDSAG